MEGELENSCYSVISDPKNHTNLDVIAWLTVVLERGGGDSVLQPVIQDGAAAAGCGHLCSVLFHDLSFHSPCNYTRECLRLVFPSVPTRQISLWILRDPIVPH